METSDLVEKRSVFAEISEKESTLIGKPLVDFCKVYDFTPRRCDTLLTKKRCKEFWSFAETRADIVFAETKSIEGAMQSAITHMQRPKTEDVSCLSSHRQSRDSRMRHDMYAGFDLSIFVPYINRVKVLRLDKSFSRFLQAKPQATEYAEIKETIFKNVEPYLGKDPKTLKYSEETYLSEKLKRPWLTAMESITLLGADNVARVHINPCRLCVSDAISKHGKLYLPVDRDEDMKTLTYNIKRFDKEVLSRLELEKQRPPRQVQEKKRYLIVDNSYA